MGPDTGIHTMCWSGQLNDARGSGEVQQNPKKDRITPYFTSRYTRGGSSISGSTPLRHAPTALNSLFEFREREHGGSRNTRLFTGKPPEGIHPILSGPLFRFVILRYGLQGIHLRYFSASVVLSAGTDPAA
jgi:hypothetical protein